ncbi:MAG: hypothetical protein ACR2H1_00325 [Limisphaerales bacterium]
MGQPSDQPRAKVKTVQPNFSPDKTFAPEKTEKIKPQKLARETQPERIAELNKFNQHRDISPNPILSQPAPVQPQQKSEPKQNVSPKTFREKVDRPELRPSGENSTPQIITRPPPNFTPPQNVALAPKPMEQPKVQSLPPVSIPNPQPAIQSPRRMEAQMKRAEPIIPQVQVAPQVHAAPQVQPQIHVAPPVQPQIHAPPPVQSQIHVAPPAAIQGRPQGQPAPGNRSSEGQDKNDRRKP